MAAHETDAGSDLAVALDAGLQPPMANGEVLFEQPWHGRMFGMAVALHEAGVYSWQEFQAALIEVVGVWDRQNPASDPYEYYEHFQTALLRLLAAKGLVVDDDVEARASVFAARPHDHDHEH